MPQVVAQHEDRLAPEAVRRGGENVKEIGVAQRRQGDGYLDVRPAVGDGRFHGAIRR
jgi:hypothetical protein